MTTTIHDVPERQPRERPVLCVICQAPGVWALDAKCDRCAPAKPRSLFIRVCK